MTTQTAGELVHQQDFERVIGPQAARTMCLPTALYIGAALRGHEMPEVGDYVKGLDWGSWQTRVNGWSRPGLSSMLREYGIEVASWHTMLTGQPQTDDAISRMMEAGYVSSDAEIEFIRNKVAHSRIVDLVDFAPVIVTVTAGFARNLDHHAVVLTARDDEGFSVIDPDETSDVTHVSYGHVANHLDLQGACSIVLPKHN